MNNTEILIGKESKYSELNFDRYISLTTYIFLFAFLQTILLTIFVKFQTYFLVRLQSKVHLSYYIGSRLRYGIVLQGSKSRTNFLRVFRLEKRPIRIISGVHKRKSCKTLFKSLQILTLRSIYINKSRVYRFKQLSIQKISLDNNGTNSPGYET